MSIQSDQMGGIKHNFLGVSLIDSSGIYDKDSKLLTLKNYRVCLVEPDLIQLKSRGENSSTINAKITLLLLQTAQHFGVSISHQMTDLSGVNYSTMVELVDHMRIPDGACVAKCFLRRFKGSVLVFDGFECMLDLTFCKENGLKVPNISSGMSSIKLKSDKKFINFVKHHPEACLFRKVGELKWKRGLLQKFVDFLDSISYVFSLSWKNGLLTKMDFIRLKRLDE